MNAVLAGLIFAAFQCALCAALATDDLSTVPVIGGPLHGWKLKETQKESAVLHTLDHGRHWLDRSPPALKRAVADIMAAHLDESARLMPDVAALCPLDAHRAWISITAPNSKDVLLEYTDDDGKHWKESVAPVAADHASISFVDELHGFLLAMSSPAAGHMAKEAYGTQDGGKRWKRLTPPPIPSCYPTGISFRSPLDGWITASYRGGDEAPFYRTRDARTWKLQRLNIPDDYRGGYAETFPPVFTGVRKRMGFLPVKLVRHTPQPDHEAWVVFLTEDGGATWR